jgi:hypothetical protein
MLALGESATGPDGTELLRSCSATIKQADGSELSPSEIIQSAYCIGYVSGVLDGLTLLNWKGGETPVCLPAGGVGNEQAVRVVVKYLRENPAELHVSARVSVLVAIGEAFKCK